MVQNGVLRIVGEILGHRDLSVTQRYAHLSPEHLRESIRGIDKKCLAMSKKKIIHFFPKNLGPKNNEN